MSRLLTEQAKAIQTNLSLFYETTCSHFMFCYKLCITSFFVSVYPITVFNVFVVCTCVHCVEVCVCVCVRVDVQYKNVQSDI